jgi:hypothetical protein
VSNKRAAVTFKRGLAGEAVQRAGGNHSSRGRQGCAGDESGAVLMLALAYIIAISLIVGALADWAMNDLNNTTKFNSTGQLHSAVSSVTDLAIQNIRDTPDPSNPVDHSATGLGNCWEPVGSPDVSQYTIDTYAVAVWCNTTTDFANAKTRTVTFYACLSSFISGSSPSQATITIAADNCQTAPVLTAVVVFDDYPARGAPGQTVQCKSILGLARCGEGMKLQSWIWG